MAKEACLPLIFPDLTEKLVAAFQFVGFFASSWPANPSKQKTCAGS